MNLKNIGIIIRREYLNKVKKKSFLVTTFLVPVLMAVLCVVPAVLMMTAKEKTKFIGVVDQSGIVMPTLEDNELLTFIDYTGRDVDSVKSVVSAGTLDAALLISELDEESKSVTFDIVSSSPLGIETNEALSRRVNDAVENYRISSYNIDGLDKIINDVKPHLSAKTYTIDDQGKETVSEEGVFMALSMLLGILLFMFITVFGGMVMSAVIEEKSSRVVEVLISSVKATELMFGKIIGVALVALTQFFLWIVLTGVFIGVAGSLLGGEALQSAAADPSALIQSVPGAESVADAGLGDAAGLLKGVDADSELGVVLSTVSNLPFGKIIVVFLLFFVFGYVLYASLFAAIGAAVENEGDASQLQLPVTIPLMLGYFIAIYAFRAPESSVAFWGSMIPFTSPIVMLSRLPFGVPTWEIVVSLLVLVATCVLCIWISARIYKAGILVFGKKSTFKDLWKWFKMK